MTVAELYKQVAHLGFEDSLENIPMFFYTLQRAVMQVNELRPIQKTITVRNRRLYNHVSSVFKSYTHRENDIEFAAPKAVSYYFECDGNGMAQVQQFDNNVWSVVKVINMISDGDFKTYKGFIKNGGDFLGTKIRLVFSGDFVYTIRNVALYSERFSDNEEDIPTFAPYRKFDIEDMTSDESGKHFMSLAKSPIREARTNEVITSGYEVIDGRIISLPYDMEGTFIIVYNYIPTKLEYINAPETDFRDIPLDSDLCVLLPTLCGAYIWADDDPEKAEYYLSLYRELAAGVIGRYKNQNPVKFKNVYGW